MPPRDTGPGPGRRRSRKVRTGLLVVIALVISVGAMAAMTAQAVIARASCTNHPTLVNLAASFDIEPAVQTIARSFNSQNEVADGRCVQVQVTSADPSAVAAQIDGQAGQQGGPPVDAWIPDSSLWVDVAHSYAAGAQLVQTTNITVARSPIILATSEPVARQTGVFNSPVNWNLVLPAGFGGPPASLGLSVDMPDPSDSAVGLLTIIEVSRLLGPSYAGRTAFTKFEYSSGSTEEFKSAAALASFVQTTAVKKAITVTSEQAVLAYDRQNPSQPLAARYPTSATASTGSPELDYPYVLTTSNQAETQAAESFGRYLTGSWAQSVIRYAGFRSATGAIDAMPSTAGLSSQHLEIATSPTPSEVATNLSTWQKLGLGSRILTIIDTSAAMGAPSGLAHSTLEQVVTRTASLGLPLFPDTTEMGLWEAPDSQSASASYRNLVTVGPLPADWGIFPRREAIVQVNLHLHPNHNPLHLNDAILAAYRMMTATYSAKYSNAVLVLTAGIDSPGDMKLSDLVGQLKGLFSPDKKVEIIILQFGRVGSFAALQQIANATGGAAYQITNPDQVAKVFYEGISQRLCDQGCPTP